MFANDLDEFDDSYNIVRDLIEEYKFAEKPTFIDWNLDELREDDDD